MISCFCPYQGHYLFKNTGLLINFYLIFSVSHLNIEWNNTIYMHNPYSPVACKTVHVLSLYFILTIVLKPTIIAL